MASVFYCFVKTKNEQFSMDDFGEKKPFSIYFLFIWGESAGSRASVSQTILVFRGRKPNRWYSFLCHRCQELGHS
jgi:hypothetical protein